jgi:hypothetical protein
MSSDNGEEVKYVLTMEDCFACALANPNASGEYCFSILMTSSMNMFQTLSQNHGLSEEGSNEIHT